MKIQGCTALVTGANRGLGRAIVDALLAGGAAKVYATARDPSSLRALADASGDTGRGGTVEITAANSVFSSGAAQATGLTGGAVRVLAENALNDRGEERKPCR